MGSSAESSAGVVIVGAGHAGISTAAVLRQQGFDGDITVVGDSEHLPYHRPPLSKSYLGDTSASTDPLRPLEFYASESIRLVRGTTVSAIEPDSKRIRLEDGTVLAYSSLVLAPGARPRQIGLPGSDLAGVAGLHTYEDSTALRTLLCNGSGTRIAIVGAGYVGLEVAAAAVKRGVDVTVIERADRALARVASTELSDWLSRFHRDRGTRLITNAELSEFRRGPSGRVSGLGLTDGTVIECDGALVGVGVTPCDELARAAGIVCDGAGIVVDSGARTSEPDVYAVGDVSSRLVPPYRGRFRLESIPSATEQAGQAAAAILGMPEPSPEIPWFWSDQFDAKIKIAGLLLDVATSVTRGAPGDDRFAVYHLDSQNRLQAVETVNSAPDFMLGKRWIAQQIQLDPSRLGNSEIGLREVADQVPATA